MEGRDRVALVLACALGGAMLALAAGATWALIDRNNTLSDSQVGLLSTVLGAVIGALSVYLGGIHAARGEVERAAQARVDAAEPITPSELAAHDSKENPMPEQNGEQPL